MEPNIHEKSHAAPICTSLLVSLSFGLRRYSSLNIAQMLDTNLYKHFTAMVSTIQIYSSTLSASEPLANIRRAVMHFCNDDKSFLHITSTLIENTCHDCWGPPQLEETHAFACETFFIIEYLCIQNLMRNSHWTINHVLPHDSDSPFFFFVYVE